MDSCMEETMDMFDDKWNMLEEVDKADAYVRDVLQYFGYGDDLSIFVMRKTMDLR